MSAPIKISVSVTENKPIQMNVTGSKQRATMGISAPIVADNTPQYEGSYTVTPSDQAQTLETQGKKMLDNVTVEAMPEGQLDDEYTITHYVPNMTVSSTGLVTVNENVHKYITPVSQSGYIASSAVWHPALSVYGQKQIDSAVYQNYPSFSVVPEVGITDNGLVWGIVNSVENTFHPIKTNGWATTNDNMPVAFWGTKDKQLDTVDGTTITPTESEQTAVAAQKFTTGEVKVAAIPSDYVGSEVPRKTSADLTASGRTITAPAGFYGENASVTVDYIIDLGEVDLSDYDDDPNEYQIQELRTDGLYRFVADGLTYVVEVEVANDAIRQILWSDEEGGTFLTIRSIRLEDGDVSDVHDTNFLDFATAMDSFAIKTHTHWRTTTGSSSVWDYCNSNSLSIINDSPIIYKDLTTSIQYLIETWHSTYQPIRYYVRIHPFNDASVFYQRVATYSGGTITWGSWYKFGGTVFNP